MLCNYVNEHQDDCDVYVGPLRYGYNSHVHRTTRMTPFELGLSRPPPDFSLRSADGEAPPSDRGMQRTEFLKTLDGTIHKAHGSLRRTQARYKRDFDKRVRMINARLKPGDYAYRNPTDGAKTSNKLASPAVGPYRALASDKQTITIDREGVTERVSADRCVYAPPPTDAPRASATTSRDLANKVTEGTQFPVERLLKHCVVEDGTTEFFIKWADYDQPTWTARTHVPEELVSPYAKRLRTRTGRDLTSKVNAFVHCCGGCPQLRHRRGNKASRLGTDYAYERKMHPTEDSKRDREMPKRIYHQAHRTRRQGAKSEDITDCTTETVVLEHRVQEGRMRSPNKPEGVTVTLADRVRKLESKEDDKTYAQSKLTERRANTKRHEPLVTRRSA